MFKIITKRVTVNIVETETNTIDDIGRAFDFFEVQRLMAKADVMIGDADSVTVSIVDRDGKEIKSVSYETL